MTDKVCAKCGAEKHESGFAWRNKAKGYRQSYCRACQKQLSDSHYERNASHLRILAKRRRTKYYATIWPRILAHLNQHPCSCGESHPAALDFHHRDSSAKVSEVSKMITNTAPWERILCEIKKCSVICSNCHRKLTAKKRGWYEKYVPVA